MADEMLRKLAEMVKAQQELDALKKGVSPSSGSRRIKKKGSVLYVPQNASGKALRRVSEMSEEEVNAFKAQNLRNRARQLRASADWHLNEAMKLEYQADLISPKTTQVDVDEIEDDTQN